MDQLSSIGRLFLSLITLVAMLIMTIIQLPLSLVRFCAELSSNAISITIKQLFLLARHRKQQSDDATFSTIHQFFSLLVDRLFNGISCVSAWIIAKIPSSENRVLSLLKSNFAPIEIEFWSNKRWILTLMPGPYIRSPMTLPSR